MTDAQTKFKLEDYNIIPDIFADRDLFDYDIFTLNHDLLLEQFLEAMNIMYCDGFGGNAHTYKIWGGSQFDEKKENIRLFKLHGSVNWRFVKDNSNSEYYVKICSHHNENDLRNELGANYCRYSYLLLMGTFNKMLQYTRGIFREFYFRYYRHLNETDHLIISGYSFGDQGINNVTSDWLEADPNRKVILIHHDINGLKGKVRLYRPAALYIINKSILHEQKFENACWAVIRGLIV